MFGPRLRQHVDELDHGLDARTVLQLLKADPTYPVANTYRACEHTLAAVHDVLKDYAPPARLAPWPAMQDAFDAFIGYLMLDALIGNTDRHHENWGVTSARTADGPEHRLAPSYDHASSLGRELSDRKREARLGTSGRGTLAEYADKATSEFAYIQAARRAEERGFEPLLSFPSLEGVYRSGFLPPLFSNRVMNPSREEFSEYVAELGLSPDQAEPFAVLARSGGRRSTDKLEVFAPPAVTGRGLEGLFLAREVRHVASSEAVIGALHVGDRLSVIEDRDNPVKRLALELADGAGHRFAYVPDYLANEIGRVGIDPCSMVVSVERINPEPAPVHNRVLCRFCFSEEQGRELFGGEDYRPISPEASDVAA